MRQILHFTFHLSTYIILLIFSIKTSSQNFLSRPIWAIQPIEINGHADEWEKPLNFYENKTKLMFGLANDTTNLYICIRVPEESNQIKISRAGLVVNITSKGKEKKTVAVAYPLGSGGPMLLDNAIDDEGHANFFYFKNEFLMQNLTMRVVGFPKGNGVVPIMDTMNNVTASINWDSSRIMEYELKIPLEIVIGMHFKSWNFEKELVLEVAINGMEKSKKMDEIMSTPAPPMVPNGSMGVNGSMSGQGMTGGMAAGMPQGSALYARNERSWLYEKTSFKQKFALRDKP